jgi:hypothetical protein
MTSSRPLRSGFAVSWRVRQVPMLKVRFWVAALARRSCRSQRSAQLNNFRK